MIYTQEEQDFFREFVPGHPLKQIQEEFSKRFDKHITLNQLKGYLKRNGLKNRVNGRFKKGNIPQNCKPVGAERLDRDGYVEIKISDPNKWQLKHRYLWEKENGKVPKGMVLIFKDNNKLNIDLDNLILISRAENMKINSRGDSVFTGQAKETAVNLIRLENVIKNKRRKERGE